MIASLVLALLATGDDQRALDQISFACGLKSGDVTIESGKLVRIRPKEGASFEAAICLLPKLKDAGYVTKIGFVSEPAAVDEE